VVATGLRRVGMGAVGGELIRPSRSARLLWQRWACLQPHRLPVV